MTTEKQNEANRENALQSTGPKTEEGKAIVCKNAVKHGIFTKELIISSGENKEDRSEYETLLSNLMECINPKWQLEAVLTEKIAADIWRLRRVIRFETGSICERSDDPFDTSYTKNRALLHAVPESDSVELVLRYERSLEKSILQKIILLKNLKLQEEE